jgi:hypothetical protein
MSFAPKGTVESQLRALSVAPNRRCATLHGNLRPEPSPMTPGRIHRGTRVHMLDYTADKDAQHYLVWDRTYSQSNPLPAHPQPLELMREPEARGFYARQSRTGDWQKSEEDEATEELATFHAALQTMADESATAVARLAAASTAFAESSEALAALLEGHAAFPPPKKRARSPPRDPQRGGTSAVHVAAVTTKAKCVYDTGLVYTKCLGILADLKSDRQRAIDARAADSVRRLQELHHGQGARVYHEIEAARLHATAAHADTGVAAVAVAATVGNPFPKTVAPMPTAHVDAFIAALVTCDPLSRQGYKAVRTRITNLDSTAREYICMCFLAGALSQHTRLQMPDVPTDWAKKVDLIFKSWAANPEELRRILTNGP